jgi:hypothetical protein
MIWTALFIKCNKDFDLCLKLCKHIFSDIHSTTLKKLCNLASTWNLNIDMTHLDELSELHMLNSTKEYIECYDELKNLLIKDFKSKVK